MRSLIALTVVLLGCASRVVVRAPVDSSALREAPGRTVVTVRSTGDVQNVSVVSPETDTQQNMSVTPWCQTPCRLFLSPGTYRLYTGSPTVRDAVTTLRVADVPVRVTARAASRAGWERGRNLVVGGVGMALLAGIFVGFSPLEITGGSPTGVETIVVGSALGVLSALLIAVGARFMNVESTRVTVSPVRP